MRKLVYALFGISAAVSPVIGQTPTADRTAYATARDSAFATPVNRSFIGFTIPQKDMMAENVAFDPRDSAFYVGSTRHGKVVRRDRSGRITDFIPTGRDGLWMVIGMKVDTARNALWVATSAQSNYIRLDSADLGKAGLFRYDLAGRLVKRYIPREAGQHFFNDIVITGEGTVYVTDMFAGSVYRVAQGDSLVAWIPAGTLPTPNGITVSGDNRTLFVPTSRGIYAIDRSSRAARLLEAAEGIDPLGIDGLYWHDGSLIGIQGGRRNMVQRFAIDTGAGRITSAEVLEANHPMFMNPTTGVIAGSNLFYIANSQFRSFANGKPFVMTRLFETVILRLPLR